MKKTIILFIPLVFFVANLFGQQSLSFEAGQVFSKFRFVDNKGGQTKDFEYQAGGCYNLHYNYITQEGIFVRLGVGMRKSGATTKYGKVPVSWNLNYLDATIGLGYAYTKIRFKPYFCAEHYFGFLLKAWQTLGSNNIDLKKYNNMSQQDFGLFVIPGVRMDLSDQLAVFSEYKQMIGLANLEKSNGQKLNNRGFIISLGVAANISQP